MDSRLSIRARGDRVFLWSLAITVAIRACLAAVVPLSGDEAYFVLWGEHLDAGYYDHTPMVGWWLSAVLLLGKSTWLMRVPALLTTVAVALLLWRMARELDVEKAGWVATLYLWSPHNVLNFFTTTDTPLLLFSVIAGAYLFRAARRDRGLDYLLTGAFLGLAFLSKYFAVLLGLAVAVALLCSLGRPRWRGLVLVLLGVLPSVAINIAWNYEHGWTNILFNLFNRTRDASLSVGQVLSFFAITVLPIGPIAWHLVRTRTEGRLKWSEARSAWKESGALVYVIAFVVPLGVLLTVSSMKSVGAHWPLSFFPFLFLALTALFTSRALARMTRGMIAYGFTIAATAAVVMALPVELLRSHKSYDSVVLSMYMPDVLARLERHRDDYLLATPSYSKSALFAFYSNEYVPVIGPGSYHGRQDDLITDVRGLDHTNIMVLCDTPQRVATTRLWFDESTVESLTVRGAEYHVVLGRGFRYPEYREAVIERSVAQYYRMPSWLASWSKPSFFFERYGLTVTESKPGSARVGPPTSNQSNVPLRKN